MDKHKISPLDFAPWPDGSLTDKLAILFLTMFSIHGLAKWVWRHISS